MCGTVAGSTGIDHTWCIMCSVSRAPFFGGTCRYDGAKEVRTDSGMRYLDLAVGDGVGGDEEPVQDGDKVTIYFTSRLWGYNGMAGGTSGWSRRKRGGVGAKSA